MPIVRANGVDLFYEDAGDPHDPVILLIMGLGTQLIAWPNDFVAGLVANGFRVIRYDNRDIGLSTHLDGAPALHPLLALAALRLGLRFPLPTPSRTWRRTPSGCSTGSASSGRMSSASRWAA